MYFISFTKNYTRNMRGGGKTNVRPCGRTLDMPEPVCFRKLTRVVSVQETAWEWMMQQGRPR